MTDKEKLYETMGELLYVLAMADGVIQPEETKALSDLLDGHQWAKEIQWSFDYEEKREGDVEDLYKKVILQCQKQGPSPEYQEFIQAMEKVAAASEGVAKKEKDVINSFAYDLIERFKKELE